MITVRNEFFATKTMMKKLALFTFLLLGSVLALGGGHPVIGTQELDPDNLTEETTPAAGDLLFGWESGGTLRKFDVGDLPGRVTLGCALSDNTSDLVATTGLCRIPIHAAFTIDTSLDDGGVRCTVLTAPTTTDIEVDINEDDGTPATILSTVISIDATEDDSMDSADSAVVSDAAIAAGSQLIFDLDQIGSGTAGAGLVCTITGSFN